MEPSGLQVTWFALFGVLIGGYAILDGFDLGVGVLSLFDRSGRRRRLYLNAIGPVWDGNEVWLVTAGGALFAAFPAVYATVFSAFYLALMLLLVGLILRAVSLEFRGKVAAPRWQRFWDGAFGIGSLLAALLFGVAVGNLLKGIPLDAEGIFRGDFPGLLYPYALLVGLLGLTMFTTHGALYMALKSEGELRARTLRGVTPLWIAWVLLYAAATILTLFVSPWLIAGAYGGALFWVALPLLLIALLAIPVLTRAGRLGWAFTASSAAIAMMIALAALGLYPRLVPSSLDLAHSLTIANASSTPRTLRTMLVIALVGMPIVIGYTIYIYRVFKGKVEITEASY